MARRGGPRFLPKLPANAARGNADRWAWIRDVMADGSQTHAARNVAIAYGMRVNEKTGWTWAGSQRIGDDVAMRRGDVRRHVEALTQSGRSRPY